MVEVVIAMIILIVLHNCSFLSLIVYDTRRDQGKKESSDVMY